MTRDLKIKNWSYWRNFPSKKPQNLILLLHGCGGNAGDILSLAPMLAERMKAVSFVAVAPDGFLLSVEKNDGYQWFDIENNYHPELFSKPVEELTQKELQMFDNMVKGENGLFKASEALNTFLNFCQEKFDVSNSKTSIIGWSQGGMTALDTALSRTEKVKKVISISGGLIPPFADVLRERKASNPEVVLIHGTKDDIISFKAAKQTEVILRRENIPVHLIRRNGMSHGRGEEATVFWTENAKDIAAELLEEQSFTRNLKLRRTAAER